MNRNFEDHFVADRPSRASSSSSEGTKRRKGPVPKLFKDERCKVCGDRATGFHYKVVSCEGCKGFFRRASLETKVYRCKGKDVGKCMEDQFLQRKCKDCRYQACLNAGMKKEYLQGAKPKKGQKMPKERELGAQAYLQQDPGKDRLLQIAISFWSLYKEGVKKALDAQSQGGGDSNGIGNDTSPEGVTKTMINKLQNLQLNIPDWDGENSRQGQAHRMRHMMSMANIHKQFLRLTADALPYFSNLSSDTKETLLKESVLEVILLRAASCYDIQHDSIRSIQGASYNFQIYQQGGVSPTFSQKMREFIQSVLKLKLTENHFAILAIMCLMSPDRGPDVGTRDRQQLSRIQEIFSQILSAELHQEKSVSNPAIRFANFADILTKLRDISHSFSPKFNNIVSTSEFRAQNISV